MKAIGKYIIITEPTKKSTSTKGGLLLNEESRDDIRYREGVIVMPGTEVKGIEIGNTIYFDRHAGFGIEINNNAYKVIKETDVVVIL